MRIDFAGRKWHCLSMMEATRKKYDKSGYVYMITYIQNGDRKVAYVGASNSMKLRISSHPIVSLFRQNNVVHKIELLYFKSKHGAFYHEDIFIGLFYPPLNGVQKAKKYHKQTESDMWKELGVINPVSKYYRTR